MKLNIVRQPLIPAFLTLVALAAAAMWQVADGPITTPAHRAWQFPLPGELLLQFQVGFPLLARIAAGIMIVWAGLTTGRLTVRYGFYAVSNCLAIPLYGIIACAIPVDGNYLATCTASLLLSFVVNHFFRACRNGYSFDPVFRASFYLSILIFVYPPALPLVLMMPLAVLVFRRTLRETAVATIGILLPVFTICYVGWGAGYDFDAPLLNIWSAFIANKSLLQLFTTSTLQQLAAAGAIFTITLASILVYLSHGYTTGSKPRFMLTYNIGIFLLCILSACLPSADWGIMQLFAIPAALFLPILFVRINHRLATPIYLILLGVSLLNLFV